jgi:hypothetical protein
MCIGGRLPEAVTTGHVGERCSSGGGGSIQFYVQVYPSTERFLKELAKIPAQERQRMEHLAFEEVSASESLVSFT